MDQRVGESGEDFVKRLKNRKQSLIFWSDKMPAVVQYEMVQEIRQINEQLKTFKMLGINENDEKEC